MAKADEKTTQNADTPAMAKAKDSRTSEVGTLTYARAVKHFGQDNALAVMRRVAELGGHGMFEDADLMHPLFGGLAMPNPASIPMPRRAEFAYLPDADFRYEMEVNNRKGMAARAERDLMAIENYFAEMLGTTEAGK